MDMVRTAADLGATLINYAPVVTVLKAEGVVCGVGVRDAESGREIEVPARVVINATGAFVDSIRRLDDPQAKGMIRPSQGVHIVLGREFLPGSSAIMVPHTDDGRVLFAIPWHDCVVVGTTDTPVPEATFEPRPQPEELEFLLGHAARYLTQDPTRSDVRSAFAGIRPLVGSLEDEDSAAISRDHTIHVADSCLVTVAGGKWTTYRKMAEDAVDHAATLGRLEERPCRTAELHLHGYHRDPGRFGALAPYGADAEAVDDLLRSEGPYGERLHPAFETRAGEVIWAVRQEMARTVEDFLARRTRCLLRNARATVEMAPKVAAIMARELRRDEAWQTAQVDAYRQLAAGYRVD